MKSFKLLAIVDSFTIAMTDINTRHITDATSIALYGIILYSSVNENYLRRTRKTSPVTSTY